MKEMKICLPVYKIIYSICFIVFLSLVRGISSIAEIGITMDAYIAVLAIVFCADTYWMEHSGKRWEVFCLYSVKKKEADNFEKTGCPVDLFMGIGIDRIWTVLLAGPS